MECAKLDDYQNEDSYRQKMDWESLLHSFADRLKYSLGKDKYISTRHDCFISVAFAVRDRLINRWLRTQQEYYHQDAKRVYYLSMEFLIGRMLGNSLINLGIYDECKTALHNVGYALEDLREMEWDAGLGNGGLGRLAACFLDSMATLQLPVYGYGIRYEYGIFHQHIRDGYQIETPDNWLRYPNPWEIPHPEFLYPVRFYGKVNEFIDKNGRRQSHWVNTENVMAMAYDMPVPGYQNNTVNTLRLWSAKSTREFNLDYFYSGDYIKAVEQKNESETISKVLYPNDDTLQGKELRLKQEYFLVSATLQDIFRRYDKIHHNYNDFPDKVAIHLNDTHPAIGVIELMRIFLDEKGLTWEKAWELTTKTFAYTNHTILPEALEKWKVSLIGNLLPRHLQIIYEANRRFLDTVWTHYPGDIDRQRRMSLIEEGTEKKVRMANLSIVGSHSVNGVSELHTEIIKKDIFKDFYELTPWKFNNKTNGITQRRWLLLSNFRLSNLLADYIGKDFVVDLYELKKLIPYAEDEEFQQKWREVKLQNKKDFSKWVKKFVGIDVDPKAIFDFQVKRIHEYKRQLLNALHVVHLYNKIRFDPHGDIVPRTVFFAGKAAPAYYMAKLTIKLITSIAHIVNNDPITDGKLRVVFLPNYGVSLAQKIFPASDLSEQISTAGKEASGTGNMKFALNGALTIGTLDGANVEIREEVGEENIFIFGLRAEEVLEMKAKGYDPWAFYNSNADLKRVLDMIRDGIFCPEKPKLFQPIIDSLLKKGDEYMLLADFESYVECQEKVAQTYKDQKLWTKMSIMNVANMGKFSTDRTIQQYAEEIWKAKPVPIPMEDESHLKDDSLYS